MYVLPLDTSRLQCFIVLAAVTTIIIIIVVVLVVVVTDMDSHSVTCSNQLVFFNCLIYYHLGHSTLK